MEKPKISILLPVFNEGINLKIMLKILKATIEVPHEIIVVYDIESDDSIPVVKDVQKNYPNLKLVHNKIGRGVVNAIKSGVNAAYGDYILILVADDVGPVLAVEDMLYLMDKGCDFVSTTRYAYGGRRYGGSLISRVLSKIANKLFIYLAGSSITDCTCGIKIFRKEVFNKINFECKPIGWAVALEFSIKVQMSNWKLGEVPIISINRFYCGKFTFLTCPFFI